MDFKKMRDLTTDDFIIYEDGVVFNNDSIFKMMKSFPKYTAEYEFENLRINVDNNSGNINYFNHANFVFNDTTKVKFDWLESATFKKIDGKWKMDFLHSTVRK
ncbi:nuclear transport factor 2 family protein [Arenibacter sp. BSSL-BM3]|uniref:Nuclear transport factor 2 family protein n=1 Tax=Arenibacter arenosicollis TaxID=2762274 RepID=A0ABR7QQ79_9FLAO|nr:nuclear transport factor 2 family protein [Arenibacter arenosicollis]MBC8769345.1 nuclear transport factor 2 family protein [Arenibacter arenosicollis]